MAINVPEQLLALKLVELLVNVRNCVFNARNNDVFERAHTAIGDLERFVDRRHRRLQRGELDEEVERRLVRLLALVHGATTLGETNERFLGDVGGDLVKDGNLDAGHIVDQHLDLILRRRGDVFNDLITA